MRTKPTRPQPILTFIATATLVLGYAGMAAAGPLDDPTANGLLRFAASPVAPPFLAGKLDSLAGPIQVAGGPQATFYAAADKAGKAHVWLVNNNVMVADFAAAPSREHMFADWAGSFAFWLGPLPVVAISWKFGGDAYGIEDFAFWAAEGGGRFLGGLPGSTRSGCAAGDGIPNKDCARCPAVSGIPVDLRLAALEPGRARFVQKRAATWYYFLGGAAELFDQDFLLTATGLAPDGQARRTRNAIPLPQAQERIKLLLREYFRLAKTQSRQSIAPEFLTCFEQIADLAPDFGQAHYNVGCMHALLGNHKEAVIALTKALSLSPQYRKLARKDPDLASVRDEPEIVKLLGEPAK